MSDGVMRKQPASGEEQEYHTALSDDVEQGVLLLGEVVDALEVSLLGGPPAVRVLAHQQVQARWPQVS